MLDVVHYCRALDGELWHPAHPRATGHCGLHHRTTHPHCRVCDHDLTLPGHGQH